MQARRRTATNQISCADCGQQPIGTRAHVQRLRAQPLVDTDHFSAAPALPNQGAQSAACESGHCTARRVVLTAVRSANLSFGAVLASSITGHLNSGALRLNAVYADRRHPSFPNVPTLKEAGVPVVQASFGGVLAPARTPDAVVAKLEASCRAAVASPKYQEWARGANQVVDFRDGKTFERDMREDSRLKAATIQRLGLSNP